MLRRMPWPCVARGVLLVTATRPGTLLTAGVGLMLSCVLSTREARRRLLLRASAISNAQLRVINAGGWETLAAPSIGDQQRQLGGSRRRRVSARAPAACTRGLTVMGTALTPRVHTVQVGSCSLAGAIAPRAAREGYDESTLFMSTHRGE